MDKIKLPTTVIVDHRYQLPPRYLNVTTFEDAADGISVGTLGLLDENEEAVDETLDLRIKP